MLLILAGVTIATISGNNSAPQKATEAAQKDAIAGAKDEIAIEIQEALLNYYNNKYVSKTSTGAAGEVDAQSIVAEAAGRAVTNAKSRNKELEASSVSGNTITLKTKSFEVTGTIETNGGITWSDWKIPKETSAQEVNALIGATVNYSANGITSWRVFYSADGEMFIIPSGMASTSFTLSGDNKAGKYTNSNDVFSVKNPEQGSTATYRNVEYGKKYNIQWYNKLKNGDTMNIDVDSSSNPTWRSRATAYLCDPANWGDYVAKDEDGNDLIEGSYAVGGPTEELLVYSWNQAVENGGTGAPTTKANWAEGDVVAGGYLWNKPYELSSSVSPSPISSGILSRLYNNGSNSYWLTSPSSSSNDFVCRVDRRGYVSNFSYYNNGALRPLVSIPLSNVTVENGTVTIE